MTTTTIEHGFTVNPQAWPDQVCYVVMCLCGWSSPPCVRRDLAEACGDRHVANPNPPRPAPVVCAPWCCYGAGHPDELYPADQCCASVQLTVPLSMQPNIEDATEADYVDVYAMRRPGEAVQVDLSHAGGPEIRFTLGETRQLVEALQLVLGQVQ